VGACDDGATVGDGVDVAVGEGDGVDGAWDAHPIGIEPATIEPTSSDNARRAAIAITRRV
jgi:hypothetical protein